MTPASAAPVLHMIGNAHIDPVWLWRWPAGVDEALATFRSAADRCDEYPQFVFTRGEAWLYRWVARLEPELSERVDALVRRGQWHVTGSMVVQPDANLPTTEGWRRQLRHGRRYFTERFGLAPTVAYNVDSFGHPASLPDLLAQEGCDAYVFHRPHPDRVALPAPAFRWRGSGGAEVLGFRIVPGYVTRTEDLGEQVRAALDAMDPALGHAMCFYGVGNHGGGPTRANIEWILEHAERRRRRAALLHPRGVLRVRARARERAARRGDRAAAHLPGLLQRDAGRQAPPAARRARAGGRRAGRGAARRGRLRAGPGARAPRRRVGGPPLLPVPRRAGRHLGPLLPGGGPRPAGPRRRRRRGAAGRGQPPLGGAPRAAGAVRPAGGGQRGRDRLERARGGRAVAGLRAVGGALAERSGGAAAALPARPARGPGAHHPRRVPARARAGRGRAGARARRSAAARAGGAARARGLAARAAQRAPGGRARRGRRPRAAPGRARAARGGRDRPAPAPRRVGHLDARPRPLPRAGRGAPGGRELGGRGGGPAARAGAARGRAGRIARALDAHPRGGGDQARARARRPVGGAADAPADADRAAGGAGELDERAGRGSGHAPAVAGRVAGVRLVVRRRARAGHPRRLEREPLRKLLAVDAAAQPQGGLGRRAARRVRGPRRVHRPGRARVRLRAARRARPGELDACARREAAPPLLLERFEGMERRAPGSWPTLFVPSPGGRSHPRDPEHRAAAGVARRAHRRAARLARARVGGARRLALRRRAARARLALAGPRRRAAPLASRGPRSRRLAGRGGAPPARPRRRGAAHPARRRTARGPRWGSTCSTGRSRSARSRSRSRSRSSRGSGSARPTPTPGWRSPASRGSTSSSSA